MADGENVQAQGSQRGPDGTDDPEVTPTEEPSTEHKEEAPEVQRQPAVDEGAQSAPGICLPPELSIPELRAPSGEWPEAIDSQPPTLVQRHETSSSSHTGSREAGGHGTEAAKEAESKVQTNGATSEVTGSSSSPPAPAGGLRRYITQLSNQLADEVRRREQEEGELEKKAAEKKRLLQELDVLRQRRETLEAERRDAEFTVASIEKQHASLAEQHLKLRAEVAQQEEEIQQLREEAKARSGLGRDWARDGPEKDALVETNLRIAEAHDELAQLQQQLKLNREGLRRQLAELQAENELLRTGRLLPKAPSPRR